MTIRLSLLTYCLRPIRTSDFIGINLRTVRTSDVTGGPYVRVMSLASSAQILRFGDLTRVVSRRFLFLGKVRSSILATAGAGLTAALGEVGGAAADMEVLVVDGGAFDSKISCV